MNKGPSVTATSDTRPLGEHAVVIGGGIAGLIVTHVLAGYFERVTLFERDAYPGELESRKGVPQGRHVHGVLAQGLVVLERMFPGLIEDMIAGGAVPIDWGRDLSWYYFGGYKPRLVTGTEVLLFTRPFLESHLRRRLAGRATVAVRERAEVSGLIATPDHARIVGVTVRPARSGDSQEEAEEEVKAQLVVDASGRGSRSPRWLAALGFPPPRETEIGIDVRYVSRFYRRGPDDLPGTKVLYVVPEPPHEKRGGAALPVEGDRWLVTLIGYHGEHPPADEEGFLEFARSLPAPDIHELITRLDPVSSPTAYGVPVSVRHRYDTMSRYPVGYIVVGDAVCAFNPIFAQGMTVAALEAQDLGKALDDARRRGGLDGMERRFMRREARTIFLPWRMASHEDFRFPETRGRKPLGTRMANWYVARMQRVSRQDVRVYITFLQVMHMLRSPVAMFRPDVVLRVLRGSSRSAPRGGAEGGGG